MPRSWPLGCLGQTSSDYIYSDDYLLGFNLQKKAVVVGGGLKKDGQKNRGELSGIIKQCDVSACSGNNRAPSYKIL